MDEASFIDTKMFLRVIVPMVQMAHAALILISSPLGPDNYYMRLIARKDPVTNEPLFNVQIISSSCEVCLARGIEENCKHRRLLMDVPWKDAVGRRTVEQLYEGNEDLMRQEIMGDVVESAHAALDAQEIKRFSEAVPFSPPSTWAPNWVLLMCDPSAGGDDETALCAAYMHMGTLVVTGLDSQKMDRVHIVSQNEQYLRRTVRGLRALTYLQRATLVFCVETNTGVEVVHMYNAMRAIDGPRVHLYQQKKDDPNKMGVWTDDAQKQRYLGAIRERLARGSICYNEHVVCENAELVAQGLSARERAAKKQGQLEEQLLRLRLIPKESTDVFSKTKTTWSGKVTDELKKTSRLHDDLAFTLGMACWLAQEIVNGTATWAPPRL